jgi:spore coat protein U-like protein
MDLIPSLTLIRKVVFLGIVISVVLPVNMVRACVDYYVQAPNFNYDPQSLSPALAVTTINITKFTCPQPVYLRIDRGSSLSYQKRQMNSGNNRLNYNFYLQPSSASPVWGDGSGGTYTQLISGATSVNLYTIIDPQQNIVPGHYTDSINFQFAP